MTDWRYWITYEGIVTAEREETAMVAAMEDSFSRVPEIEIEAVEPIEGGEGQ